VGVVDQFVVDDEHRDPVVVERYERERSAVVRQLVMARSKGCCEWCGLPGFKKHDGQIYLESHHVVPLYQDGDDSIENVIALCPNDHRMAHYGENRDDLAIEMLLRVEEILKAAS
jgi:predicted HNH restriction endonuclease